MNDYNPYDETCRRCMRQTGWDSGLCVECPQNCVSSSEHTPGPWRAGKSRHRSGSTVVVCDTDPTDGKDTGHAKAKGLK